MQGGDFLTFFFIKLFTNCLCGCLGVAATTARRAVVARVEAARVHREAARAEPRRHVESEPDSFNRVSMAQVNFAHEADAPRHFFAHLAEVLRSCVCGRPWRCPRVYRDAGFVWHVELHDALQVPLLKRVPSGLLWRAMVRGPPAILYRVTCSSFTVAVLSFIFTCQSGVVDIGRHRRQADYALLNF